ncbi:hypothetical protein BpHYR1_010532 [Brachionus plicatilis]|uniref:Uncharacterized protein n=1 Tax=Brachionus plicatilis TaxID=10195 RepID=A0A3M7Q0C9_BRAPC|nr:hypothetical protein BpHYR1_010532 [Brachionus plicatilis]
MFNYFNFCFIFVLKFTVPTNKSSILIIYSFFVRYLRKTLDRIKTIIFFGVRKAVSILFNIFIRINFINPKIIRGFGGIGGSFSTITRLGGGGRVFPGISITCLSTLGRGLGGGSLINNGDGVLGFGGVCLIKTGAPGAICLSGNLRMIRSPGLSGSGGSKYRTPIC